MSDEEHHFESKADAGASKTYPQQAGTIRKNGYIVIKGRPCKVQCDSSSGMFPEHWNSAVFFFLKTKNLWSRSEFFLTTLSGFFDIPFFNIFGKCTIFWKIWFAAVKTMVCIGIFSFDALLDLCSNILNCVM